MRGQYEFNPAKAETSFGDGDQAELPAWKIDLGNGQTLALSGRVDRIDLCDTGAQSLAVVMDYKSSEQKLDNVLLAHGVQLQLLGYLAAIRHWPEDFWGGKKIIPAGVFYVNLRGHFESGGSRGEVLAEAETARRLAYQHTGRFNAAYLEYLDRTQARDQFNYKLKKDGTVWANSVEALTGTELNALIIQAEERLKTIAQEIYAGKAAVSPYQKGAALKACKYCAYRAVCRFDEWIHEFRELKPVEPANENEEN
jgi:ATP-dependent helicase/nuclease subunit B